MDRRLAERGLSWRLMNSAYIILSFIIIINFTGFIYIGYKVSNTKWKAYGFIYVVLMSVYFSDSTKSALGSSTVWIYIISWIVCIVHSFIVREEFLLRLDAKQRGIAYVSAKEFTANANGYSNYNAAPAKAQNAASVNPTAHKVKNASVGTNPKDANLKSLLDIYTKVQDEAVKEDILTLYRLGLDIYKYVDKYPESMSASSKFNTYYFPETIKILYTYIDFDAIDENSPNAKASMEKIVLILKSMITAFKKQLDTLASNKASDINSDIQVLETILSQEGLGSGPKLD